jgi:hypothetical protein
VPLEKLHVLLIEQRGKGHSCEVRVCNTIRNLSFNSLQDLIDTIYETSTPSIFVGLTNFFHGSIVLYRDQTSHFRIFIAIFSDHQLYYA